MAYLVYVIKQRSKGSEILLDTKTQTPSFNAAVAAFWDLHQQNFDNKHLLLMTKNRKQINAYRYQSVAGDRDFVEYGANLND